MGDSQCGPYVAKCSELCNDDTYYQIDVSNGEGTYSCSCCTTAQVTPAPAVDPPEAKLDFSQLPVSAWVVIFLTPVALWTSGFVLMKFCKRGLKPTDEATKSLALKTDDFEFPFGRRFFQRVEAVFSSRAKTDPKSVSARKARTASTFFEAALQQKTSFLQVDDHSGPPTWVGTDLRSGLEEKSGLSDAIYTWRSSNAPPRKGLSHSLWRCRSVFNFLFGVALSLAFGTVALDSEAQTSCTASCTGSPNAAVSAVSCSGFSSSFSMSGGGGIGFPDGSAAYLTTTGLVITLLNAPTTSGMSFFLKRSYRTGPGTAGIAGIVAVAIGLAAVGGGVVYLINDPSKTPFDVSTKLTLCITLTFSQMFISLVTFDLVVHGLLHILAKSILSKYIGAAAEPRNRDLELNSSPLGKLVGETILGSRRWSNVGDMVDELTDTVIESAFEHAKVAVMKKLRPKLAPILKKHGLQWKDVLSAAQTVEIEHLQAAVDNPENFLTSVCFTSLKSLALYKLKDRMKARLEPAIAVNGGKPPWEKLESGIDAALALLEDVDEIEALAADPETYLLGLLKDLAPELIAQAQVKTIEYA